MGNKLTLELDWDKLSKTGLDAVRTLLNECESARNELVAVSHAAANPDITKESALRFVSLLTNEKQGNQLRILEGYLRKGKSWLTYDEICAAAGKSGPALAGMLSCMTKNWRKAGMPGRVAVKRDWQNMTKIPGAFWLGGGDDAVFFALVEARATGPGGKRFVSKTIGA